MPPDSVASKRLNTSLTPRFEAWHADVMPAVVNGRVWHLPGGKNGRKVADEQAYDGRGFGEEVIGSSVVTTYPV